MNGSQVRLRPIVSWPDEVEAGRSYLVTVDVELADPADDWPYDQEEYAIGCMLEGRPGFAVDSIGDSTIVVHRFGGTYGPARFVAHAVESSSDDARALRLTLITAGGVPFRTLSLPVGAVRSATVPPPTALFVDTAAKSSSESVIPIGTQLDEPSLSPLAKEIRARYEADAEPQYEAKLLLVGEGNVGKSSLVTALAAHHFVADRPTTHGLEVTQLFVPHPRLEVDITLNIWDFGGQEVYRITQQVFFTSRALYLLVWRPRQEESTSAIEAWISRLRLRVGDNALVILVETHADERVSDLNYRELERRFGSILVGYYRVDNQTGNGIEELRSAIAEAAARLPQMGERISRRWVTARNEVSNELVPYVAFAGFRTICKRTGIDSNECVVLAQYLHHLGDIVYYGEDEGLRDIIVLQPEWITAAFGYVLEDTRTRDTGGILDHTRLRDIWDAPGTRTQYPLNSHPYLLRLMEKFEVSYRMPDENRSLVPQLVPYERPALPWDTASKVPDGIRKLALICSMAEGVPGLIALLTVRNSRFSTGLHWRHGVFLAHRNYDSDALFELINDRALSLTVLAPSPDYFFSILRDSLENLLERRWPGLAYELLVPCPHILADGTKCSGQFNYRTLLRFRERAKSSIECYQCLEPQSVTELLTGFAPSGESLDKVLEEVRLQAEEVTRGLRSVKEYAAETANQVRAVLRAVSSESSDCPRLFTLVPRDQGRRGFIEWRNHYQATLWCEHPGKEHPWMAASYNFLLRKSEMEIIAPYALLVAKTLALLTPTTEGLTGAQSDQSVEEVSIMLSEIQLINQGRGQETPEEVGRLSAAEQNGARAWRITLFESDPSRSFGDLRRVLAASGDFLWVCTEHYHEYDPGLPTLPS